MYTFSDIIFADISIYLDGTQVGNVGHHDLLTVIIFISSVGKHFSRKIEVGFAQVLVCANSDPGKMVRLFT